MNKNFKKVLMIVLLVATSLEFKSQAMDTFNLIVKTNNNLKDFTLNAGKGLFDFAKKNVVSILAGAVVGTVIGCGLYAFYKYRQSFIYHSLPNLKSIEFQEPTEYNSGAAIKKGGFFIQKTEVDDIWALFAGFKKVCSISEICIGQLKEIIREYGKQYPNVSCKIFRHDSIEPHYIIYSPSGEYDAFLLEKNERSGEGSFYSFGYFLGYDEEDIQYFYERTGRNNLKVYRQQYNRDKKTTEEFINSNIDTIEEWAQDNIEVIYSWPEEKK